MCRRPVARRALPIQSRAYRWIRWMRNCEEFGVNEFKMSRSAPGHRACDRPGARCDAAGHDGGLRRFPYITHGAFGALAFGIGTSEVEHVMATQCLLMKKSKPMLIVVEGELGRGVTAKDIALAIIGKIGTAGGTGYAIEFGGARSAPFHGRSHDPVQHGHRGRRACRTWSRPTKKPSIISRVARSRPRPSCGTRPLPIGALCTSMLVRNSIP